MIPSNVRKGQFPITARVAATIYKYEVAQLADERYIWKMEYIVRHTVDVVCTHVQGAGWDPLDVDCIYTIVLSILLHVIFTRNERTKCYYKILTTCIVCIVSWYLRLECTTSLSAIASHIRHMSSGGLLQHLTQ